MARINLLPWREELRERRKKTFVAIWGASVACAALIIFSIDRVISDSIRYQEARNQYIERELQQLDQRIVEIKEIKNKKVMILDRMAVIKGLEGNRPVIVQVFDQLARIVPEGIYFRTLQAEGKEFSLVGVAESNNRVAVLMRQLDASPWFADPNLTAVRKVDEQGEQLNEFDLSFTQTTPDEEGRIQ
ncbi:PilN domain-containing protein [Candidatus Sororendozoicomonas aggregata]|uniref:PilN domain-containing protein n=1 Tax=Candidatus Sororendozoicomonas aggregata TaxID=3073239 RepID=UPI002ED1DE07